MVSAQLSGAVVQLRKPDAVIFDLDGIILDSEPLQQEAYIRTFSGFNVTLTVDDLVPWMGCREAEILAGLSARHDLKVDGAELKKLRSAEYTALLSAGVPPMDSALDAVALARRQGITCAIATSSSRAEATLALEGLGILGEFAVMVTGDDVRQSKPEPDVYLRAVELLGVPAARCVAIEDTGVGVDAAASAGICVIAVPHSLTRHHDFRRASGTAASVLEAVSLVLQIAKAKDN